MKKAKWIFFLLILSGISISSLYRIYKNPPRLNILIISTCSLRYDLLRAYQPQTNVLPNLNKFFEKSFAVSNPVNETSWASVAGHLVGLTPHLLKEFGYNALGEPWNEEQIRWGANVEKASPYHVEDKFYPLMKNDFDDIKKKLVNEGTWPFLLEMHISDLHFPYGRNLYDKTIFGRLSSEDRSYINEYVTKMSILPERIAFALLLAPVGREKLRDLVLNSKYAPMIKGLGQQRLTYAGLVNNRRLIDEWKKSPFYEADRAILKKVYIEKVKAYDEKINNLLKFLDEKRIAENTVIIFTGDHGEAFGEHGSFIHGETVFDEMVKFPLLIKFPGMIKSEPINIQFNQKNIMEVTAGIMNGSLTKENFAQVMKEKFDSPQIISKTCGKSQFSVRHKSEWKWIINFKNNQKYLYNLKNDPAEMNNVIDSNARIAFDLNDLFLNQFEILENEKHLNCY